MAAASLALEGEQLPFASLFSRNKDDGTWEVDRGLDLYKFLHLVIHPDTYRLEEHEVCVLAHHKVHAVISVVACEIVHRAEGAAELQGRRLKGLSEEQKRCIESVLVEGAQDRSSSLALKDCSCGSVYDPKAGTRRPWAPVVHRAFSRVGGVVPGFPVQVGEDAAEEDRAISIRVPTSVKRESRAELLRQWVQRLLHEFSWEGIKYLSPYLGSALEGSTEIVRGFLLQVVSSPEDSAPFIKLVRALQRHRVPYPGKEALCLGFLEAVIIPETIRSMVPLNPLFPVEKTATALDPVVKEALLRCWVANLLEEYHEGGVAYYGPRADGLLHERGGLIADFIAFVVNQDETEDAALSAFLDEGTRRGISFPGEESIPVSVFEEGLLPLMMEYPVKIYWCPDAGMPPC